MTALLFFGWLADALSIRASIVAMAVVSLSGVVLVTLRLPQLWRYGVTAVPPAPHDVLPSRGPMQKALRLAIAFLSPRADKTTPGLLRPQTNPSGLFTR